MGPGAPEGENPVGVNKLKGRSISRREGANLKQPRSRTSTKKLRKIPIAKHKSVLGEPTIY